MSGALQRIFFLIVLGILLIFLGNGLNISWLNLIGSLLYALTLFWGGFFLPEEKVPIRVTMIAIAGLAVFGLISSSSILPY